MKKVMGYMMQRYCLILVVQCGNGPLSSNFTPLHSLSLSPLQEKQPVLLMFRHQPWF